ncbi:hypothetical protein [Noviherbaspirillum sp. ST9]|uniref:hypothetical protein n=1 Tax=Noviherbaspirillum sp. ST9 TaxID=3401606 RepID=UPI003B58889C
MNIEPPSLNIPLERKEHWGLVLCAACAVAIAASALVSIPFAKVFAASCIVGLPVLWLIFFPSPAVAAYTNRAGFMRVLVYFVLFSYLAIAKRVLVPSVLAVIEHVLA